MYFLVWRNIFCQNVLEPIFQQIEKKKSSFFFATRVNHVWSPRRVVQLEPKRKTDFDDATIVKWIFHV